MPMYEIEYDYPIVEEDTVLVDAADIDEAEKVGIKKILDELSETIPHEITELDIYIHSIKEITPNV